MKRRTTTTHGASRALACLVCDVRINLAKGGVWIGFACNLVANHPRVTALLSAEELKQMEVAA